MHVACDYCGGSGIVRRPRISGCSGGDEVCNGCYYRRNATYARLIRLALEVRQALQPETASTRH